MNLNIIIIYFMQTLVSLPMDEFNDMLSKNELSEDQLNVCRDIRRRGKNKVHCGLWHHYISQLG